MISAAPRKNANRDASIRPYRTGTRSAIRESACDSSSATGSGRSCGATNSASADLGSTDRRPLPRSCRSCTDALNQTPSAAAAARAYMASSTMRPARNRSHRSVRLGPYGFPYLAAVLSRLLNKIGVGGPVDVLGLSWGGALAQQFAFQNPRSCRRLILVSTGTGMGMVPGKPAVLVKMATTRRFRDHDHAAAIAGDLYGGTIRSDPSMVTWLFDNRMMAASRRGYLRSARWQQRCGRAFALPLIRQKTLIVAGADDRIIPVANARMMAAAAASRDAVRAFRWSRRPHYQRSRTGTGDRILPACPRRVAEVIRRRIAECFIRIPLLGFLADGASRVLPGGFRRCTERVRARRAGRSA